MTQARTSTITRRTAIAGLAAGTTFNVGAIALTRASGADPVFAAIECHRALHLSWSTAVDVQSNLRDDDPRYGDADEATDVASDDLDDAAVDLLNIVPTTIAGAAALLRYAYDVTRADGWTWPDHVDAEEEGEDGRSWSDLLCGHVAQALEKMTVGVTS